MAKQSERGTSYGYCDRYARLDLSRQYRLKKLPLDAYFYYQTKFC